MMLLLGLTDFLLYAALALLTGYLVLHAVPEQRKPVISISRRTVLLAALSVPLFSAAPVLQLAALLTDSIGAGRALWTVLTDYRTGQSYLAGAAASVLLFFALRQTKSIALSGFFLFLIFISVGYASHSASLKEWQGFILHTLHLLMLSVWGGILLLVAWFAPGGENWRRFLRWFTPAALLLMAGIFASGLAVMLLFTDLAGYAASWVLPYGQLLLLKHIGILPLLGAACINGFIGRSSRPVQPWLRLESLLMGAVFLFTAFMSKMSPPHEAGDVLRREGAAPLVEQLSGPLTLPIRPQLEPSLDGLLLTGIGFLCFVLFFLSYGKKLPAWLAFVAALGTIAAVYAGLMMNMSF